MPSSINASGNAVANALGQLQYKIGHLSPVLMVLGEDMVERVKQRFAAAKSPTGVPWRPNTAVTLANYIRSRSGISKKTGKMLAKGKALAAAKRPLQGRSGALARQIFSAVAQTDTGDALTMGSTMRYARMQHSGGTKAKFPNLWGDIPARPFMPLTPTGELERTEEDLIVEGIRQYITS